MNGVFMEALVCGIILAIILVIVFAVNPGWLGDGTSVAITGFILGFAAHLVKEYSGVNKWYCDNGAACK